MQCGVCLTVVLLADSASLIENASMDSEMRRNLFGPKSTKCPNRIEE
jgi:hypothetical protein